MGGSKKGGLPPKQARFCEEYLIDLNASDAAKRAGYSASSAKEQGYELLKKPAVKAKIDKLKGARSVRTDIKVDEILRELYKIATADLMLAYNENGQLLPIHKMPEEIRKAISGVDIYKDFTEGVEIGETKKIKFWDKLKALELLGKHLSMFTDKIEHSGGINLSAKSDEELDQEIKELMEKDE